MNPPKLLTSRKRRNDAGSFPTVGYPTNGLAVRAGERLDGG
jgi:hypothetical protein